MSYVNTFFSLEDEYVDKLYELTPKFGYDGYGEIVYYRTYSRMKSDGGQESWHDTVLRVINGTFSIRKDHYNRNMIPWNETEWQHFAFEMAKALFEMKWLAPGRGLWAMGTPFIYERGSMALYNCAYTDLTNDNLGEDLEWLMDSLMMGVGVGWSPKNHNPYETLICSEPVGSYSHIIEDTREAWALSVKLLVDCYLKKQRMPVFNYSQIRIKGLPIRGFGGLASGPQPLMLLHKQIMLCFKRLMNDKNYTLTQFKADVANMIGCCVVAGNVRRSAEIGLASIKDTQFMDLKDYDLYPDREDFGWMSNNTVLLEDSSDFELLGEIARRVTLRGEPGIANLKNFKKGRLNGKNETRKDVAIGANPCGEIQLEHRETCNVVETCPTNCATFSEWLQACQYATVYASTVSLLPTHQPSTNSVVMKNRRIGVSIIDFTGWVKEKGMHQVIKYLRKGYKVVRKTNQLCNSEAGVPEAIKVTAIKPGGTVPKLVGKTAGAGYPTSTFTLRRTRIATNHPMVPLLQNAGIPMEPEKFDPTNTLVFEYPIKQGPSKPAEDATLWEQALNIVTLQREWADNSVSNTLYFKPKWILKQHVWENCSDYLLDLGLREPLVCTVYFIENDQKVVIKFKDDLPIDVKLYDYNPFHEEDDIEPVMSAIVPLTKMISFLPHSAKGVYAQMPEEEISEEEYNQRVQVIDEIDWSQYSGSDGQDEKYCTGDLCEIPVKGAT